MAFFSIVIPLYNKENYIENTLKSVLAQTFTDFEILIINDGSTDFSEAKVLQFADSRIKYHSRENEGASAARNFGIDSAKSNYITFLDADDYWYPEFLQTMFQNIEAFPEEKVFSAAIETETPKKIFGAEYSIDKTAQVQVVDYFPASFKETAICTSCAVFHKSVFEKVGNFDTTIRSGQDTDLWIRIGLVYKVVFDWKILARYVFDAKSLSKNKSYSKTRIRFEKFAEAEKVNPDLKKFLDLNRYSIAIKSKINGDFAYFKTLCNEINLVNLSVRKKMLLFTPRFLLRILIRLK